MTKFSYYLDCMTWFEKAVLAIILSIFLIYVLPGFWYSIEIAYYVAKGLCYRLYLKLKKSKAKQ